MRGDAASIIAPAVQINGEYHLLWCGQAVRKLKLEFADGIFDQMGAGLFFKFCSHARMMQPAEHRANRLPMPLLIGANTVQVLGYYQPQRVRFAGQLIDWALITRISLVACHRS